ncbi:MAG TPA: aminopeptidase [Thermoplasmata archaeon]|nr:aminopeptidase [Thermoplasmata archaeon]
MVTGETTPPGVARALLGNALHLRSGEHLAIVSWTHTLPWAAACVTEARRLGARPFLVIEDEPAFWKSIEVAPRTERWSGLPAPAIAGISRADALVYFPGPADRPRLRALPPGQLSPFLGADDEWLRRTRRAGIRGVRCLLGYASDAQADRWSIPGAMWRSQLIRAITEVDAAQMTRDAKRVGRLLALGRTLRVTGSNGTDVTLRLRGRAPWIDDGTVDAEDRRAGRTLATSPGGSITVAVDEDATQGTIVSNRPSYLSSGKVSGVQWEVENGRLRNYWYSEGAEAFEADFGSAPRGAHVVSLFAIGVNPALAPGVPHAEDEEAGTVTIAIGGNSLYGGRNRCRYLSWITVGEGAVTVDGHALADRGKIL